MISLRRSSVRGGITSLIVLPSFDGLKPRFAAIIAFSMSLTVDGSKGITAIVLGSGAEMFAMFLIGIVLP